MKDINCGYKNNLKESKSKSYIKINIRALKQHQIQNCDRWRLERCMCSQEFLMLLQRIQAQFPIPMMGSSQLHVIPIP